MDFKNFDWSFKSIAKIIGLALAGILVIVILFSLISLGFKTIGGIGMNNVYYDDFSSKGGYGMTESAMDMSSVPRSLNQKIIMPPEPETDYTSGDTSEDFEIREHNATIRTYQLNDTCSQIASLKKIDYVIFENANEDKKSCYYSFKVKRENESEILGIVKALNPENFNTNIQTIKKIIDDYDTELDILTKKLKSIEDTLEQAQKAYDELQQLATEAKDIESLAKIIDNKLNLIDRLSQQRIDTRLEIDRYNKAKGEQLDRLQYVYFDVNIYEDLIIDFEQIKQIWKNEIQNFFRNINEMLQNISINLVEYILRFVIVTIYFLISLGLIKMVWIVTKRIWKGKGKK